LKSLKKKKKSSTLKLLIDYKLKDIIDTLSETRIFGIPLNEVIEKEKFYPIPRVVKMCFDLLIDKHLNQEGIFRVSPSSNDLDKLKLELDEGNFDALTNTHETHVIAGALKLFLRTLPEPILTFNLYKDFMSVLNKPQKEKIELLNKLFMSLPQNNYEISKALFLFLKKVSEQSDLNRMTASNLAIVFGPNVLRSRGELVDEIMQMVQVPKIVQTMIEYSPEIFIK